MKYFCLIFFVIAAPLFAQDTTNIRKNYVMEELVVTASRTGIYPLESPVSVKVIHRDQIEQFSGTGLTEILSMQSGFEVKDYGGTNGAKLISLRGSTAEQVLVLINGVRVNSSASGVADLSLYDLGNVDRIEILRGGASGLYGSDAVGGVVNVITKTEMPVQRFTVGMELQTSSFDHRIGKFLMQIPLHQWDISAVYRMEYQPDSSYRVNDRISGKTLTRVNSSTRSDGLTLNLSRSNETWDIQWFNRYFSRHAEIPNTIENNTSTLAQARQDDRFLLVNPKLTGRLSQKLEVSFSPSYTFSKIGYENQRNAVDDFTVSRTYAAETVVRYVIGEHHIISTGYAFTGTTARGSNIENSANYLNSLFAEDRIRFSFFMKAWFDQFQVFPFVRWDRYSVYGDALSPKIGFNLSKKHETLYYAIRASMSKNFRAPTFNERFWNGDGAVGNKDIKPERSISTDAGMTVGLNLTNKHAMEWNIDLYRIRTDQQIVWQQGAIEPALWSPVNLASTLTKGIELAFTHRYAKYSYSEVNYTYNRALDMSGPHDYRLRYSPLHSLKLSNTVSVNRIAVSQNTRYVSQRFVSVDNAVYLKPYWITDLRCVYRFQWNSCKFKAGFGVNNLFNEVYETIALYPGLAREWTISLELIY
jgi:outer membrane receptor for ferrienterochelin and colicins